MRAADPRPSATPPCCWRSCRGSDPCDSTSVGIEGGIALPDREDLKGLRFGVPAELRARRFDAGVREVFERTLRKIEELGGEIAEVSLPSAEHGISAYYVIAPAEASSNLARYDGVRYGMRAGGDGDLIEMYETTRSQGFGAEVKRRIMLGTYALSSGYYEAYYGQAQKVRTRIAEDFNGAFADVDFVVTPTAPSVAFGLGEKTDDPLAMYLNDFFTVPMSLAGIPAISIPAGLAEPEGGGPQLPVGFQIAAPAFAEQKPARRRLRARAGDRLRRPPGRRAMAELGGGDRAGDPRPAGDQDEDVLRLRALLRRRAERPHLPGLPRPPRRAAGAERAGDPLRAADRRWRWGARSRRARSSTARTTSIPTARRPTRSASTTFRSAAAGRLGEVRIHRAHLEEDAAKMIHVGESGRIHGSGASLVDFNRGGTPLVEIVTEPDLRGAAEAAEWARLLRETVRQLGVSDVNMEEGSLRVDANVSVRPGRQRGAGDQDRAEEHEQLPLPRSAGSKPSWRASAS